MHKILLLGLIPTLTIACEEQSKTLIEDQYEQRGRISIPLTATSTSGATYSLTMPFIILEGPEGTEDFSISGGDNLERDLIEGDYVMTIESFAISRETDDGWEAVDADITSQNPMAFEIIGGETTSLLIRFRVNNEVVAFQTGDLQIDIEIDDGLAEEPEQEPVEEVNTAEDTAEEQRDKLGVEMVNNGRFDDGLNGWMEYNHINRINGLHTHNFGAVGLTAHLHGFCHHGTVGGMLQTLGTIPGATYWLSFDVYSGDWDGVDEDWVDVAVGDADERIYVYGENSINAGKPENALNVEMTFTGTEDGYDLIFYAGKGSCIDIDNVSVRQVLND